MTQRELTSREQAFFLTRALIENRRKQLVEEVREFITEEYPSDDPEGMALDVEHLIFEMLDGTGYELTGIEYEDTDGT